MAAKDELGRAGEERVATHLAAQGWRILARNWRCALGELDVVALEDGALVAVEVKTRRGRGYGHPLEAITPDKLARLHRLVRAYAALHPEHARGRAVRVDAVGLIGDPASAALEHVRGIR